MNDLCESKEELTENKDRNRMEDKVIEVAKRMSSCNNILIIKDGGDS